MPEKEPIPEPDNQLEKTGGILVHFTAPEAYEIYWWFKDAQDQPVLRFGEEQLGLDF